MLLLMLVTVFAEGTGSCTELFSEMETQTKRLFGLDSQDSKSKKVFYPHTDVSETKEYYQVTVEVPGIDVKEIKVETENHTLLISGEKKQQTEEKDKDKKTSYQECRYGEFKREFLLPEDALIEKVQAKCHHNILYITIPRKPSDRKAIPIQTM